MDEFSCWFRAHFAASAPVGHCLRDDHPNRWLRLHSLADSKRYAEDASEQAEVRRRARAAASAVLCAGAPVWLVVPSFDAEPAGLTRLAGAFAGAATFEHARLDERLEVRIARTNWPHPGFDELIDQVAVDALRAVWFSAPSGEAFAPYDGGVDLIAASAERAAALRQAFPPAWLSPRADGL